MSRLYSLYEPADPDLLRSALAPGARCPTLVFLHGLLGNHQDWSTVRMHLRGFSRLTIDLCGHGRSQGQHCDDFADCCRQIADVLHVHVASPTPLVLVGYSLGARLAMYGCVAGWWNSFNLTGLVIEGGNFGLTEAAARQARWQHDQQWATRFEHEPIEQVLADWYQQPVFASLNYEQRQHLIQQRRDNLGTDIAQMMLATSLARQPDLLAALKPFTERENSPLPIQYIYGAQDEKFKQLAMQSGLNTQPIAQAGHNVHKEQPDAFANCIEAFVRALNFSDEQK